MKNLLLSNAKFSNDRIYRYALWRIWDNQLPKVLFIGLTSIEKLYTLRVFIIIHLFKHQNTDIS